MYIGNGRREEGATEPRPMRVQTSEGGKHHTLDNSHRRWGCH